MVKVNMFGNLAHCMKVNSKMEPNTDLVNGKKEWVMEQTYITEITMKIRDTGMEASLGD